MADKQQIYDEALAMLRDATDSKLLLNAIMKFESIEDYEDSAQKIEECREKIKSINKEKAQKDAEEKKQEEIVRKKTNKKNAIISVVVIIIIAVGIIAGITINSVTHKNNYENATKLLEEGKYNEAYNLFLKLGDYEDSQTQAKESKYRLAQQSIENKEYREAYESLQQLDNYKDAKEKAAKILIPYRKEIIANASVNDIVIWGEYEQDNNKSNGKEKLEWIVLDKNKGKILLLSKNIIEEMPYHANSHGTSWKNSDLRNWLNNNFYNHSFSKKEKSVIVKTKNKNKGYKATKDEIELGISGSTPDSADTMDWVFLLSKDEALKYKPSVALNTKMPWWLRNLGSTIVNKDNIAVYDTGARQAAYVSEGEIDNDGQFQDREYGVRPAMWVKVK